MAYDASPSWSGFNYQGKVALYHALTLINAEPIGTDFSGYSLMLEDTEDFEIQCAGNSISFHQVKAYNSSSYSNYAEALFGIALELLKNPNTNGRIHTWKPIHFKPKCLSLTASIKSDLNVILNEYQAKNLKDGSTILEKAASSGTGLPKTAAILKAAFPGNTEGQLYELLDSILKEESDVLMRLDSYQYDDGHKFCDLNEINIKIKSEISNALGNRAIPVTESQLGKVFYYFLGMIDKYIIQRHKAKKADEKITIAFNDIIQTLETDHEDVSQEYLAFKFKDQFAHLIDEYMGDPEDYIEPEEGVLCNLKEARKWLLSMKPEDIWAYYRSFSPQIYLEHSCNIENAFVTNLDGIRYVLIKILNSINFERVSRDTLKYKFIYRTTTLPYQNYLPTTITVSARATQIAKKIIENPCMSEVLYEVENLIYNGDEPYSFSISSMVRTEVPMVVDADSRPKREEGLDRITLVPISTAKDALT